MLKIYLSGPISCPRTPEGWKYNFQQAIDAQVTLMNRGFAVFNPMLTMALGGGCEPNPCDITHEAFIENDLAWVECADAVLRLPGESVGAEIECDHARRWGIPVYDSIADLEDDCFGECEEPFDETDLPL